MADAMNPGDTSKGSELPKHQGLERPLSLKEAPLILVRLQQSVRLLSGESDQDSRRKVLKSMELETSALAQVFASKGLSLMAILSSSAGRLVVELSHDVKSLDAAGLRTLSHALDCLRTYGSEKAAHPKAQSLPIHVLVIDDDPLCLDIMVQALGAEAMSVVPCNTAEQALNRLPTQYFDVVLSDISMPEIDGFAFIQRMRQIKLHANTPVIFVTGFDDLLTRSKSRLTGGCDFLGKPFKLSELAVKAITCAWKNRLSQDPEALGAPGALRLIPRKVGGEAPSPQQGQNTIGVISVNSEGRIKSINKHGAHLLGHSAEELLDTEVSGYLAELGPAGEVKGLTAARLADHARRATSTPVRVTLNTGGSCSMQLRVSRTGTGNSALFVCVLSANPEPREPSM